MSIKRCPADAAFSEAVRLSRGHTCERCHKTGRTECAHIIGRREKSVRWDTLNVLALCHTCHRYFTENPLDFHEWLLQTLGQGHLDLLQEKRRSIFKLTPAIRKDIARHYREQIKLVEQGNTLVSYQ